MEFRIMLCFVLVVLAVMILYSFVAASHEKRGDRRAEEGAQGVVSLGWVILVVITITVFARGCH
jgi:NADH:ubiquinone oxidoreductase subunit 6 (subunit J)